jgi:lipoprotein-releasing system ATP-binding protein
VLKGINLQIKQGEILAVLGQSGVGKSTLLNLLGLLDAPTSGSIYYYGSDPKFKNRDFSVLSLSEKSELRNLHVGFVFQFYHLLPDLTVMENVLLPTMLRTRREDYRRPKEHFRQRAESLLERVGIHHRKDFPPTRLSGGERQRAAIARALINEPELVLCDEPTGNLDTRTGSRIHDLILDLNAETRISFVLVTHDEGLARIAHRRLRMIDGLFE